MSDQDFQYQVLTRLGALHADVASIQTDMAAVKEHLKTLNGKVVDQGKEIAEQRDFMVAHQAADKAGATWLKRLEPLAYVGLAAIAVLMFEHAETIKAIFTK
jgi:hypothetical protein